MEKVQINWQSYFTEAQASHFQYFLDWAETWEEAETHHYQRLDADRHNLFLAIDTATEGNALESIQRFTWAVGRPYGGYLSTYGYWNELSRLMHAAVSASEQLCEPLIAAGFLVDLATLSYWQGQLTLAEQQYKSALEIMKSVPSERTTELAISRIYHHLGILSRTLAQFSQASHCLQKALALAQRWEDDGGIANNLLELGNLANDQGNLSEALDHYQQSLALNLKISNQINAAINRRNIGNILYEKGQLDQAEKLWQNAIAVFTKHNDKRNVSGILHTLAQLALDRNDLITARDLCTQSIDIKQQIGFQSTLPVTISLLAMITYAQGDLGIAESLFQQAISMSETIGDHKQTNRQKFNLAIFYELTEQYPLAEQLLNQVVAIDQLYNLPDAVANQEALHRVQQKQTQ